MTAHQSITAAINPRVRTSPFYEETLADGLAAVTTYNHMWLPAGYGDPEAEYRRLTEGVAMWDVAAQRHLEVSGADADRLVQMTTTVDTSKVSHGRGTYAPMVDHHGTLINDPVLLRFEDGTWRFSIADADIRLWLAAVAGSADLDATVEELDTATLAVQGPLADDVLAALGCDWASDLQYFERRDATIGGGEVTVSRSGWSNQGGYELFLDDPTPAATLWQAVRSAGAAFGIGPGTPNQSERIESVLLSYGTDTGFDADPFEVGLADHVDLDGDHFVGRAALEAIRERGPSRHLLGAVVSGDALSAFERPATVEVDGLEVGRVRAAAWSPRYGCNLGLALVDVACEPGASGSAEIGDHVRSVRFVELPFSDAPDG